MLPVPSKLALRLSCKQLNWETDNLLGLKIQLPIKDLFKVDCENFEWIKHILIRKLTICNNILDDHIHEEHLACASFLKNAVFTNLNRLSLSNLKIQGERALASILIAVSSSSINPLRELSLGFVLYTAEEDNIMSSTPVENYYNFPDLTTFNLNYKITDYINDSSDSDGSDSINANANRDCSYLKSFQQMCCPQLKCLSVSLWQEGCNPRTHYLIWYLELLEKFSSSLNYLKFQVISHQSYHNRREWEKNTATDERALNIGSQFKNLKELDVDLSYALCDGNDGNRSTPVSGWMNLFYGMRTYLEKLTIYFPQSRVCELYSQYELLTKNSQPNLKYLSVVWNCFPLDLKLITEISDQLETLELRSHAGFNKKVKNIDQIPLGLKKIVLFDLYEAARTVGDWDVFKKLISLKESLIVEYDHLISVEMAEYLGDFLTRPNFIWKGIDYENEGELRAASEVCQKFGISYGKLHRNLFYC